MQNLKNTYSELPKDFHRAINPTPFSKPKVLSLNYALANDLSTDTSDETQKPSKYTKKTVPENTSTIATAYAGHQIKNFIPQLGDGRPILIRELIDEPRKLNDIQLKGSGPTAFSRQGDGRSAIGPVIREYILSEAMHALNVPTTRAPPANSTGDDVLRETALKGGTLTRVSPYRTPVGTPALARAPSIALFFFACGEGINQ
jgi:Uncharacterized conserved protein